MTKTRSLSRAVVGLCAALAIAAPAAADHGGIHPTVRAERTYFHCAGPTKVENVNLVASGPTPWSTTAPAGSYTAGNGCGAADPAVQGAGLATLYDAVFSGTYTGNIRDMTLELHNLVLSRARQAATFQVRVRMLIDGEPALPETAGRVVTVTPILSSTGATELFQISIPKLGCSRDIFDADGKLVDVKTDGLVTENGDGISEHSIQIAIDSPAPQASAWVWDATEIASGITFNPTAPLAAAKANPVSQANCN